MYYYYRRDHLGSNREVWCGNTNITVQKTQYYPSGLPMASISSDNTGQQQRKYNGKEFVEMHGYDVTDLGARVLQNATLRLPTVDPLAEKYYGISPYVYCLDNPVRFIDPTGTEVIEGYANTYDNLPLLKSVTRMRTIEDSKVIHIYAHGNSGGFEFVSKNGTKTIVKDANSMKRLLDNYSQNWKQRRDNKSISIVLHSCSTGKEESADQPSFAKIISQAEVFKDVTIVAPNADSPSEMDRYEQGHKYENGGEGRWVTYKNGKVTNSEDGSNIPGVDKSKTPLPRTHKDTDVTKKKKENEEK